VAGMMVCSQLLDATIRENLQAQDYISITNKERATIEGRANQNKNIRSILQWIQKDEGTSERNELQETSRIMFELR
jgi:hypothetical protein